MDKTPQRVEFTTLKSWKPEIKAVFCAKYDLVHGAYADVSETCLSGLGGPILFSFISPCGANASIENLGWIHCGGFLACRSQL